MKRGALIAGAGLAALVAFLAWRLVRPLNIFVVSGAFERPMDTAAPTVTASSKDRARVVP